MNYSRNDFPVPNVTWGHKLNLSWKAPSIVSTSRCLSIWGTVQWELFASLLGLFLWHNEVVVITTLVYFLVFVWSDYLVCSRYLIHYTLVWELYVRTIQLVVELIPMCVEEAHRARRVWWRSALSTTSWCNPLGEGFEF